MTINLQKPDITELKPRITVCGVGGGGGNAVNNMITGGLEGVEFVVANTDAQALTMSKAERIVQMGAVVTEGLGAGSQPEIGRAAAEECLTEITDYLDGTHMAFITAGMGGGTGTGAAPVVARAAREMGILTVGVVTKPFHFEGRRRMQIADKGISELQKNVDTLIVIPNQNLFRIANDKTTFADAFGMADQVLYSGVACITDLMVKEGLINLDFADVRSVMNEMGKAMMGTGEASGDGRAIQAAEAAISNPLLDESSMFGAQGLLISITGGRDMTLFEVDEAATRIREEVDDDANIILGATFDENLEGTIRVSVVATGIDGTANMDAQRDNNAKIDAIAIPTSHPVGGSTEEEGSVNSIVNAVSEALDGNGEQDAKASKQEKTPVGKPPVEAVEKNGVRIEPFQPQGEGVEDLLGDEAFRNILEDELMPSASESIPPSPQTIDQGIPKANIPDVGDFPPIAQAELKAEKKPVEGVEDRGPMGLLRKLKSGFGAQDEKSDVSSPTAQSAPAAQTGAGGAVPTDNRMNAVPEAGPQSAPRQVASAPAQAAGNLKRVPNPVQAPAKPVELTKSAAPAQQPVATRNPTPQAGQPQANPPASPYAPKRGNLDQNGRVVPAQKPVSEEDQLDIPAFLRRQSS